MTINRSIFDATIAASLELAAGAGLPEHKRSFAKNVLDAQVYNTPNAFTFDSTILAALSYAVLSSRAFDENSFYCSQQQPILSKSYTFDDSISYKDGFVFLSSQYVEAANREDKGVKGESGRPLGIAIAKQWDKLFHGVYGRTIYFYGITADKGKLVMYYDDDRSPPRSQHVLRNNRKRREFILDLIKNN